MTTTTIHTWFEQKMTITHNHDVILELHDPREPEVKYPKLIGDLDQLLSGIAFMFNQEITLDQFMSRFRRIPNDKFCYKCEHNMLGFDTCMAMNCKRVPVRQP